ncbi:MAG TPA: tetratricopeptide repeat protein [Reyranella sp.]|nr:tetratricopeptide repeat protein [Reyranella sp.]
MVLPGRPMLHFESPLLGALILAGWALATPAEGQAGKVAAKLVPFGKEFALHVMEHVAASGVVEGVVAIVTPTKPEAPAGPPKAVTNNTTIFAPKSNTTNIFITTPKTQSGCVEGICVGTNLSKLYATPKPVDAETLTRKWNPNLGCNTLTDPSQSLGKAVNLDNGIGVPSRNPAGAVACYEVAARAGIPLAQYRLASIYDEGDDGVPANPPLARHWLQEAAARNFAPAQTELGMQLEDEGNGFTAANLYMQAALAGEPYALFEVFKILRYGKFGADRDYQAAFNCLYLSLQLGGFDDPAFTAERRQEMQSLLAMVERDARNGVPEAQLILANAYELGAPGVLVPNGPRALCWAIRAAQQRPYVWADINAFCRFDYPRSCPFPPSPC